MPFDVPPPLRSRPDDEAFWHHTWVPRTTSWDVASVRAALDEHESGAFASSAALADAMGRDDRVAGCLRTRVRAVAARSSLPFRVEPSDEGDGRRAAAVARAVERLWWDALPEAALQRVLGDAIMLGVAVARVAWTEAWTPRLVPLPAHYLRWDYAAGGWVYDAPGGPQPVTPGDGSWFLHAPDGPESWMGGAVRALGLPWVMRQFTYTDWARYCEKHGLPILGIEEPQHADDATKEKFYQRVRRLGREAILRLPKDAQGTSWGAGFIEPKDTSWEAFRAFQEAINTNIAVFLLGQNLTTEVQGGSYAAATVHSQVRADRLAADAEGLATEARAQVWKPWGRFNVAGWSDDLAPWGVWDVAPPEDKKAAAETLKALGDALQKFDAGGYEVADLEELAERFGVRLRRVAGVALGPEPAPGAAAAQRGDDEPPADAPAADEPAEE